MQGNEISFYDKVYSEGCPGCNRIDPQPKGLTIVYEDKVVRVHQDYVLPIEGMMVIETKDHKKKITDFTPDEIDNIFKVVVKAREAMEFSGIEEAEIRQEEKSSHYHLYWLPTLPWMKVATREKTRNTQVIFDHAKKELKTPDQIKRVEEVTAKIKEYLSTH